jgi:hypothetical protein
MPESSGLTATLGHPRPALSGRPADGGRVPPRPGRRPAGPGAAVAGGSAVLLGPVGATPLTSASSQWPAAGGRRPPSGRPARGPARSPRSGFSERTTGAGADSHCPDLLPTSGSMPFLSRQCPVGFQQIDHGTHGTHGKEPRKPGGALLDSGGMSQARIKVSPSPSVYSVYSVVDSPIGRGARSAGMLWRTTLANSKSRLSVFAFLQFCATIHSGVTLFPGSLTSRRREQDRRTEPPPTSRPPRPLE